MTVNVADCLYLSAVEPPLSKFMVEFVISVLVLDCVKCVAGVASCNVIVVPFAVKLPVCVKIPVVVILSLLIAVLLEITTILSVPPD